MVTIIIEDEEITISKNLRREIRVGFDNQMNEFYWIDCYDKKHYMDCE